MQSGKTTITICLPGLLVVDDAWNSASGRRYVNDGSSLTSNYTVSWILWSVTHIPCKGLGRAPLPSTVRHLWLPNHAVPRRKMRPCKGQTTRRWFITAIFSQVPYNGEHVSLSRNRNLSFVYMMSTCIRAAGWNHYAMPRTDDVACLFRSSWWRPLQLVSQLVHLIACSSRCVNALR